MQEFEIPFQIVHVLWFPLLVGASLRGCSARATDAESKVSHHCNADILGGIQDGGQSTPVVQNGWHWQNIDIIGRYFQFHCLGQQVVVAQLLNSAFG